MDCLFCKIINKEVESRIIYEDELVICIMDAYPNVDGHVLIIPKQHYADYTNLPADLVLHIHEVAKKLNAILLEKLHATSISMLVNYGDAQIIKHFHLHLMPNHGNAATKDVEEVYQSIMN